MTTILRAMLSGAQMVTEECTAATNGRREQTWLRPTGERQVLADPRTVRAMVGRGYLDVVHAGVLPVKRCYHLTDHGKITARSL